MHDILRNCTQTHLTAKKKLDQVLPAWEAALGKIEALEKEDEGE